MRWGPPACPSFMASRDSWSRALIYWAVADPATQYHAEDHLKDLEDRDKCWLIWKHSRQRRICGKAFERSGCFLASGV